MCGAMRSVTDRRFFGSRPRPVAIAFTMAAGFDSTLTTTMDLDAEIDDEHLARLVADGAAPEAEAMLVERFAPRIRLYGLRHLRSSDGAAELVQEVLLIVLQALRQARVEDLARIDRFMLGTCRNVVGAWRRGQRRRNALCETLTSTGAAIPVAAPARVETMRVTRCLHALSPRAHAVLILTFIEERTAEEIAPLLDLSPANVRVIRHRALQEVRECVDHGEGGT